MLKYLSEAIIWTQDGARNKLDAFRSSRPILSAQLHNSNSHCFRLRFQWNLLIVCMRIPIESCVSPQLLTQELFRLCRASDDSYQFFYAVTCVRHAAGHDMLKPRKIKHVAGVGNIFRRSASQESIADMSYNVKHREASSIYAVLDIHLITLSVCCGRCS